MHPDDDAWPRTSHEHGAPKASTFLLFPRAFVRSLSFSTFFSRPNEKKGEEKSVVSTRYAFRNALHFSLFPSSPCNLSILATCRSTSLHFASLLSREAAKSPSEVIARERSASRRVASGVREIRDGIEDARDHRIRRKLGDSA